MPAPINLSLKYRPIRIGFLVRADDIEAFDKCVRYANTMWGGSFNPIIPVDNLPLAKLLIKLFQVDSLYAATDDADTQTILTEYKHLFWPHSFSDLFVSSYSRNVATILDISQPLKNLIRRNYGDIQLDDACVFNWNENDKLSHLLQILCGAFPPVQETGLDYKALIQQHLQAKIVDVDSKSNLPVEIFERITPASINSTGVRVWPFMHYRNEAFYVGDSNDIKDLMFFWNLRATGLDLFFYDPNYSDRFQSLLAECISEAQTMDVINKPRIWVNPKFSDQAKKLGAFIIHNAIDDFWMGCEPIKSISFAEHEVLASVHLEDGKYSAHFQLPRKPFPEDPHDFSQKLILSVKPISELTSIDDTFRIPYIPKLNEFYGRNYHYDYRAVRSEVNGAGIVIRASDSTCTLRALKTEHLLERLLLIHSIKSRTNNQYRIVKRLIQQMGGIQACRALKLPSMRNLINEHNPQQPFTKCYAIAELLKDHSANNHGFADFGILLRKEKAPPKDLALEIFNRLLDCGLFKPGIQVSCPSCLLKFWQTLDEFATNIICEFCGQDFHVATIFKDLSWSYRTSGVLGWNDPESNGIPLVVTMQQMDLTMAMRWHKSFPGLTLEHKNLDDPFELDLLFMTQDLNDKLQIVLGLCRALKDFSQIEITNLQKLSQILMSEDYEVFQMFTKLSDFNEAELDAIRSTNLPDAKLILLSAQELEPLNVFDRTAENNPMVLDLEELARRSSELHFKIQAIDHSTGI